jgi:hypothetical protein
MSTDTQPNLLQEIDAALKNEVVQRHSYFQLKYFLIGKEPTNQSKMWQCLRELKTRKESLDALELEIADSKDKIELLDIGIEKLRVQAEDSPILPPWNTNLDEGNPSTRVRLQTLDIQETEIKIRQLERQKKAAEAGLLQLAERKKWLEEEARFFLETFKNLQKLEPLRPYDDLNSQKQYWGERLANKLNLKMLTHNQLDTELVETIVALPDDIPVKQQALNTLQVRHASMLQMMNDTMKKLEGKKKKEE